MLGNLVQQNLPYLTYGNSISSYQQPTYQYVINPNSVSTNTQRQVVVNPQSTSYTAGSCGTPIQPSMTTTDMVQQRRNEVYSYTAEQHFHDNDWKVIFS